MKPSAWTCGPIERHRPNILTYFKHRITNAVAEGLNSKLQPYKNAPAGSETVTTSRSLSTSIVADLTCIRFQ
ncbi:transposase [Undibacterium arcticum]|uniref:transposase n=1 Tax=Undibacterium arcticum TaxID=1762892 RepID=UPI00361169FB